MSAAATKTIQIVVNGQVRQIPEGATVADVLALLAVDPARVAIELDRAILPRRSWETTRLDPEAKLEIVQFVGGG